MAVNQAQVESTPSSASTDDPEVRMQKLQDEMDLIKVSIKRLLIDIRERMNEMENPFVHGVDGTIPPVGTKKPGPASDRVTNAHELSTESSLQTSPSPTLNPSSEKGGVSRDLVRPGGEISDNLVDALRAQVGARQGQKREPTSIGQEKLRLTKVHHLFEWTSRMVKKYGHDRLDLMLQSYRAMGYLTKESCEQVKEISKLMPSGLGESHEISPDEFIEELYALNRILDPTDTSLDRDMIEVLMEQRTGAPATKKSAPVEKEGQDTWVRIPDGI